MIKSMLYLKKKDIFKTGTLRQCSKLSSCFTKSYFVSNRLLANHAVKNRCAKSVMRTNSNSSYVYPSLSYYNKRYFSNLNERKSEVESNKQAYSTDEFYSSKEEPTPIDQQKSRIKRLKAWARRTSANFKEFLLDIISLDGEKLYRKFSAFLARNYNRVRNTASHLWHEAKQVGRGFRTFKQDIQESVTDTKDLHYARYKKVTYSHSQKMQKVTRDVIKFIPFSVFILIPGLEVLLPAWLVIFPNAIPSQFQSAKARQKKMEQLLENRNYAAERLLYKYPKYLLRLSRSQFLNEQEKKEMEKLLHLTKRSNDIMYTHLLKFKHLFAKYADFRHFKSSTLQEMAFFMGLNPVTGLNTINNLLSFIGIQIKVDNPYIRWFTKRILIRELNLFFRKIRREDGYLSMEKISSFEENKLDSILIERGIEIENRSIEEKLNDYQMWQAISNLRNVPSTLLIYCRLNEFGADLYRTQYFEQEFDLVREIANRKAYLQRKKVLEDFLGMAAIKKCLTRLAEAKSIKKREKDEDEETEEDDEENEPKTTKLTIEDYEQYKHAVSEFKLRHNTIIDQIESIVDVNDKLLEELEYQVILGFLDRKEQHILLEKYSDLYAHHQSVHVPRISGMSVADTSISPMIDTKEEINKFTKLLELSKTIKDEKSIEDELKKFDKQRESNYKEI